MSHGTQTCNACGGYLQPLGVLEGKFVQQCKNCGASSASEKRNTLRDFVNATVYDYDEN